MAASSGPPPSIARRERLENIKQREDLKDQLINKYRDRFGAGAPAKQSDQVTLGSATISDEVNRLFGSSAPMTQANLSRLERRLQRKADGKVAPDDEAASQFSVSAYTVGSVAPSCGSRRPGSLTARGAGNKMPTKGPLGSLSARGTGGGSAPSGGPSAGAIVGDAAYEAPRVETSPDGAPVQTGGTSLEWSVLDKLAAQLHKHDSQKQKQAQSELQQRLKRDLEKQMEDYKIKRDREKAEDNKYLALQVESVSQWKEEESAKHLSRNDKIAIERAKVMEQIKLNEKRREDAKLKDKQEAEDIMKQVESQMVTDRAKAEEKLRVRQLQVQDALTQSSNSQKIRDEREQNLKLKEITSVEEYQRLKELRDKEARDQSTKEKDTRDKIASVQATRASNNKLKEQEAEIKSTAERAEKDNAAAEREATKKELLAAQRQDTQEFLRQQIQQKQSLKRAEEEKRRNVRTSQEADANNFEASERQKRVEKRQQLMDHSKELERQVASKVPSVSGKDCMSECELRLNKRLLESVTCALGEITA